MELPEALVADIRAGNAVLFLGAGASIGAESVDGRRPLSGLELRDALVQRFLGGKFANDDLVWVSELAIAETNLGTVQNYVAELFADLNPAEFHKLLPTFKWRGFATTNYDRLVERTYEVVGNRAQHLVPFISNRDRVDEKLRSSDHLGLLKLHGCTTRTHDPELPRYNQKLWIEDFLLSVVYLPFERSNGEPTPAPRKPLR